MLMPNALRACSPHADKGMQPPHRSAVALRLTGMGVAGLLARRRKLGAVLVYL